MSKERKKYMKMLFICYEHNCKFSTEKLCSAENEVVVVNTRPVCLYHLHIDFGQRCKLIEITL